MSDYVNSCPSYKVRKDLNIKENAQKILGIADENMSSITQKDIERLYKNLVTGVKNASLTENEESDCESVLREAKNTLISNLKKTNNITKSSPYFYNTNEDSGQIDRESTTQLVSINSKHRRDTDSSTSNFMIELDTVLTNVVSLHLHTITIPTTWNNFSKENGNSCMEVGNISATATQAVPVCRCITDNKYTIPTLIDELNEKFADVSLNFTNTTGDYITIKNNNIESQTLTFYKPEGFICDRECLSGSYSNYNLGWFLGFRLKKSLKTNSLNNIYIEIEPSATITGDTPIDVLGLQNIIVALDDFNKNHMNKSIVSAAPFFDKPSLPEYYISAKNSSAPGGVYKDTSPPVYSEYTCVENPSSSSMPFLYQNPNYNIKTTLTNAQLTTINSILETHQQKNYRLPNLHVTNSFSLVPTHNYLDFKTIGVSSATAQPNSKIYFNPVSISRLQLQLYDDNGKLLNLNNADWSCSIKVTSLYNSKLM